MMTLSQERRKTVKPRVAELLALGFALLAVVAAYGVACRVFDRIPHLEDELAYWWQAQVFAGGEITVPSPPEPKSFLVPFVVDYQGRRFSKYPPGWSAVLALGMALGLPFWVNPLLAGLAVWLTYRLGARLWSPGIGLLAAGLTLTSPFFWLNAGSLLSHMAALVFFGLWVLGWLQVDEDPQAPALSGLLLMGASTVALALTRPWTAVGVLLPFVPLLLHRWWRKVWPLRALLHLGAWALVAAALLLAWNAHLTGDPFRNPYTLWWAYDRLGFGPGHGPQPEGHTLRQAWINTRFSLQVGWADLFGWFRFSWLLLPLGLLDLRRRSGPAWALAAVPLSLVGLYLMYWVGAWLYGPRYYFEGLYGLTLLTAGGAAWLARQGGRLERRLGWRGAWSPARVLVGVFLGMLVALNLWGYLPRRLAMMRNLYGISRQAWVPFQDPARRNWTPALVIVKSRRWMPYGALLPLQDPWLTTPWIFAWDRGPGPNRRVAGCFPYRRVFLYEPVTQRFTPWQGPRGTCPGSVLGPEGLWALDGER